MQAKDLQIGDTVLSADGAVGIVQAVTVIAEPQTMYNLTVELVANYLVGDGRWVGSPSPAGYETCFVGVIG